MVFEKKVFKTPNEILSKHRKRKVWRVDFPFRLLPFLSAPLPFNVLCPILEFMKLFLANSSVIGIIVTIALVAITIAVCFYILSLKDKEKSSAKEEETGESEQKSE